MTYRHSQTMKRALRVLSWALPEFGSTSLFSALKIQTVDQSGSTDQSGSIWLQNDFMAEAFQTLDQLTREAFGVSALEIVGTEINVNDVFV